VTEPPASPLEASDAQRAAVLKRKVLDRIRDLRRHLNALEFAMASFGEDFDVAAFTLAFDSDEPDELNRVKAVERGVDQLYNSMAELTAFGLELAGDRGRNDETNARRDLEALARLRIVSRERVRRLQRLRELRRLIVHEYPTASARQVHEAARIVSDQLPASYRAYSDWIRRGFGPPTRR
jgi:uncharacterized protein YutE (UPF0331/DUF86 family)